MTPLFQAATTGKVADALDLLREIVDIDSRHWRCCGRRQGPCVELAARLKAPGAEVRTEQPAEAPGLLDNLLAVFHGT